MRKQLQIKISLAHLKRLKVKIKYHLQKKLMMYLFYCMYDLFIIL